jgi:hypothetical protein
MEKRFGSHRFGDAGSCSRTNFVPGRTLAEDAQVPYPPGFDVILVDVAGVGEDCLNLNVCGEDHR